MGRQVVLAPAYRDRSTRQDFLSPAGFLTGLFFATAFLTPTLGTEGNVGRNTLGEAARSRCEGVAACAPVNASMAALRLTVHDSGSGWFAPPSFHDQG
jgi:hypothetical protein